MEPIQIVGIDELSAEEQGTVNRLANEYYEKIQRALQNVTSVILHVKVHKKGGSNRKYDLRAQVKAPTKKGFEAQDSDWDLARTLHTVFNAIERQIEHRFKD